MTAHEKKDARIRRGRWERCEFCVTRGHIVRECLCCYGAGWYWDAAISGGAA